MRNVSVVIPTYNGKELLEEYLPSLKTALELYPGDSEVIIVDNGSSDDSVRFLEEHYPETRILRNKSNEGFGPAVNKGVREAGYEIVLLLNNDIRVEQDFIAPLVGHFDDPSVFAVVSKSLVRLGDRVINESITVPGFDGGLFFSHQPFVAESGKQEPLEACTNFHASGGFAAFDRKKFLELGGFDDIYHPFYYEDVDLSFQAWKRGWKVLYDPKSIVHHRSHATSRRVASDDFINRMEFRNRILLTWKNVSDPLFALKHLKWLFGTVLLGLARSRKNERVAAQIIFSALKRLPAIIRYRMRHEKHTRFSDKFIFTSTANITTQQLKFERLPDRPSEEYGGLRILLIDPIGYQKGINVGLAYLAGSLKKAGYMNVDILDLNNVFDQITDERISEFISRKKYDIVGFSVKTPTCIAACKLAEVLKKSLPDIVYVAGGPHVTLNHEEFMRENMSFDYAVIGEGDESFVELCKMIESGTNHTIEGVFSRGETAPKKPRLVQDINNIPLPNFESIMGSEGINSEYLLVTSRGCPYSCIYCSVGLISGRKMRYRQIESVISELKWAKEKFNCSRFNIVDDNFTMDIDRAKLFCDRLVQENLKYKWACGNGIRADRVDSELSFKMKQAGCDLVCVGVENADPAIFNTINKGETLDDIKRGIHFLKSAGIEVVGFFIIGLPGDTKRSSEMALDFIKESGLDSARFGILLPYPGTKVFDNLIKKATFIKNYKEGIHFSDELEPVFETPEFSAAEMAETYKRLYTRLRYFTFLMPERITEFEKMKRIALLLWKHDKRGFFSKGLHIIKQNCFH